MELPIAWKIHPVVSIAQLEPLPLGENPYRRPRLNHPPTVEINGDTPNNRSYKIKKLVDKRTRKYNKINVVQYLIKCFGYGPEYNQWKNFSVFKDCLKLVGEYEAASFILAKNNKKRRNRQRSR